MTEDDDLDALLDRLERAAAHRREARSALGALDVDAATEVAVRYRRASNLLDGYEDRATGSGDFTGYLEFRQEFDEFVDRLPEDLPRRSAFEAAQETLDRRRLSESHFEQARDDLAPAAEVAEALSNLEAARDREDDVRRRITRYRAGLADRRDTLSDLADLDPTALDTPVEELRRPVERFNAAVREAHARFLERTPIRAVLDTYNRLSYFPVLGIQAPPSDLTRLFDRRAVGDEPLGRILEYLSYSRSKLDHYVEDAGHFLGEVRPHSRYLEGLGPDPFVISWPPPPADTFLWELRERRQAVTRLDGEEPTVRIRNLEELARTRDRYNRLRSAAVLQEQLDQRSRQLVISGEVEDRLAEVEDQLARIDEALAGGR